VKGRGGGREGREGRDPPRVGGPPHFQILKNTLSACIQPGGGRDACEDRRRIVNTNTFITST